MIIFFKFFRDISTIQALGFTVRVYKDYSRSEILSTLEKYGEADFSDCEMFGMAMLSHGLSDGRILTGRSQIQVNNLVDPIKMNETLHGKPKVAFRISIHHIFTN